MGEKTDCTPDTFLLPIAKHNRNGLIDVGGYLLNSCIKIKITAPQEEWESLYRDHLAGNNTAALLKALSRFIQVAENYKCKKELTTRHKNNQHFIHILKIQSGLIYKMLKYWRKLPVKTRPAVLQALVQHQEEYSLRKSKYDVPFLTETCIEALYGTEMTKLKIRAFDDPANFYRTYIQDGEAMLKSPYHPDHEVFEGLQYTMGLLEIMEKRRAIQDKPTFDFVHKLISTFLLNRAEIQEAPEEVAAMRHDLKAVFHF